MITDLTQEAVVARIATNACRVHIADLQKCVGFENRINNHHVKCLVSDAVHRVCETLERVKKYHGERILVSMGMLDPDDVEVRGPDEQTLADVRVLNQMNDGLKTVESLIRTRIESTVVQYIKAIS